MFFLNMNKYACEVRSKSCAFVLNAQYLCVGVGKVKHAEKYALTFVEY